MSSASQFAALKCNRATAASPGSWSLKGMSCLEESTFIIKLFLRKKKNSDLRPLFFFFCYSVKFQASWQVEECNQWRADRCQACLEACGCGTGSAGQTVCPALYVREQRNEGNTCKFQNTSNLKCITAINWWTQWSILHFCIYISGFNFLWIVLNLYLPGG